MTKDTNATELPLSIFLDEIKKVADRLEIEIKGEKNKKIVIQKDTINRYYEALCVEFLKDDKKSIKYSLSQIINDQNTPKALLFGAGVSMDKPFELPAWNKLLQRAVVGEMFKEYEISSEIKYDKFLKVLVSHDDESDNYFNSFDLYELGQFIEDERRRLNNSNDSGMQRDVGELEKLTDSEMFEIVKKSLCLYYGENEAIWARARNGRYKIKSDNKDVSFIDRLRNLAVEKDIKRIITYNYDNAFEYTFSDEYLNRFKPMNLAFNKPLKSVFIEKQFVGLDEREVLPIYHVHGYIPIFDTDPKIDEIISNEKDDDSLKKQEYLETKKLILSEESYDAIEHSSYKWRNVVQIDTFLRYNCIFFGFSATDKNFKRIVKLMGRRYGFKNNSTNNSKLKHYIFLNIDDYIENIFGTSVEKIINGIRENGDSILCYPSLNKKHVRFAVFSLAEYLSTLCSSLEVSSESDLINRIIKCKERLFKYVNDINNNIGLLAYTKEDMENIDKAKFQDTDWASSELSKLINLFKEIDNYITDIRKSCAKTNTINYLCNKIEERLEGLLPNVDMLVARLQCLHFTLRTKRKYLKRMNIYPIWTTIKNLKGYLDYVLKDK